MGEFLKSRLKWSSVVWFWFWAGALLVLPNCLLDSSGYGTSSNIVKGPGPHTSAIFCDIERVEGGRRCADPDEIPGSIRLAEGAIALVAGQTSDHAIDDSPEARSRCSGEPEIVFFEGPFPEGKSVCLDCGVIPGSHANSKAVCMALCEDVFGGAFNVPPSAASVEYCESRARLSTNFPTQGCFDGACVMAGTLDAAFDDPRRIPEPVIWLNLIGTSDDGGGTLSRTAGNPNMMWDAGAASKQTIEGGDGYVEFTAVETSLARMGGLSSGGPPDTNPDFTDIGFGIDLFSNGEISIFESGILISTFGPYTTGEKFRVKVKDKFNGTAEISYARVVGPCVDGNPCSEAVFHTSSTTATYPIRVDASLFDAGAELTEVRLVRIH